MFLFDLAFDNLTVLICGIGLKLNALSVHANHA